MRIILFTSNALRHKYVANSLFDHVDEMVTIVESKGNDVPPQTDPSRMTPSEKHFLERYTIERQYFGDNSVLKSPSIPLLHPTLQKKEEVNLPFVYDFVQAYKPDAGFVFGSSILREPLLSSIPSGKFINMHLGLSPYTRGSSTNFWPFVTGELEYVGVTLLHIDPGIDSGDIVVQGRPNIVLGDTVHTVGNKTIKVGTELMVECLARLKRGENLQRIRQWEVENSQLYKRKDFSEESLVTYRKNLDDGMLEKYLKRDKKPIRTVSF